jgi:hypothetical protein
MNDYSGSDVSDSKVARLDHARSEFDHAGDHVRFAHSEARPSAAAPPLARRFSGSSPRLTISSGGFVSSQTCLVSEVIAAHLDASFVRDNYPNGEPNHGRSRLVERVPSATCAGECVSSIVTTRCVLDRDTTTRNFVMTGIAATADNLVIGAKHALDGLGWDCAVAPDLQPFDRIRDADPSLLRSFDPRHTFLSQASGGPSYSRSISN